MAEIGWIDFSTKDRNRVGSVLDLLRPEGRVDELGIGIFRDALADLMFPGISTIQTRAKYFFIVPYILYDYLKLDVSRRKKQKPSDYLENREYEIMWYLAEKYQEGDGVIGISKKRPEKIIRRPSAIYWNGLNIFRFLNSYGLAVDAFLNNANKRNLSKAEELAESKDGSDDRDASFENFFNLKVEYLNDWDKDLSLDLTLNEAEFFRDTMLDRHESVLSLFFKNNTYWSFFKNSNHFIDFARHIHSEDIPANIKKGIILAHDFACLIEGAHIAYNQEIQTQFFGKDYFAEQWNEWYNDIRNQMIDFDGFQPEELFSIANTARSYTKEFIRSWWNFIKTNHQDEETKKRLIREQEYHAKRNKARLRYGIKYDVKEGFRLGLGLLDYRFGNVKTIVNDIKEGLKND